MNPISRRSVLRGAGAAAASLPLWSPSPASAAPEQERGGSRPAALDAVVFGDPASERAHHVTAELSDVISGGLGQPGRVLRPQEPASWWGGTVSFTLRVDPDKANYVTVKFWGDDVSPRADQDWRLQIFLDGDVLGWFDQGVVDNIDVIDLAPRLPGRFYCHTLPLPLSRTRGRRTLEIEIRAMGRIYPYGATPETYYYPMTTPSRGLYRAYTHTTPHFTPAAGDVFGEATPPGVRPNTDAARIAAVRARVLADQETLLYTKAPASFDGWAYITLLDGYYWPDSPAYRNPDALERVCQAIDGRYRAWRTDDRVLTASDQQWEGFGRVGLALTRAWDDLQDALDRDVVTGQVGLANLGFEAGGTTPAGWTVPGWAANGIHARDTTVTRGGKASLKIVSAGQNMLVTPASRSLVGPGELTYSVWVNTDGAARTPHVLVQFWNASGGYAGGSPDHFVTTGADGWQELTRTVPVPAGATEYELWLCNAAGETAWYDDVTITAPPPVAADPVPRRRAYRDMMLASREYWRQHQRHYTNQAQFTAIGIYECNRGLALLSPADAWPEERAKRWIYESLGMVPWRGPETPDGEATWRLGHDYHVASPKGLTRELGYVADYGEIAGMLVRMYEVVTGGKGGAPDERLRRRMVEMVKVRGWFRHPGEDADGHRGMRIETQIGWRNEPYPGDLVYVQRTDWDGHPLQAVAVLQDPALTGWAHQMVEDGQLAPQLDLFLSTSLYTRVGLNAFRFVSRDWPAFQRLRDSGARLPARWEAPDFVFTDETVACVAVKRGKELFYASLYWRARQAVNDLARVHLLTPQSERSATVRETSVFDRDPENVFIVQDWAAWDFAINDSGEVSTVPAGGPAYPGPKLHQAFAGEKQYLAPIPADVPDPAFGSTTVGVEKVLVGKAPFYVLEYAGYIVVMNTTTDQTFTWRPSCSARAADLRTGRRVTLGRPVRLGPQSTLVLYDPDAR
ncbi:hypothetical protein J2S43_001526 [Catenuloplanes nepalensis]|uniref:Tat pathway signal sequence domain protein n=1 Tax=Catenuloplanes nepalensis TaxID=587533 RepID=A0ABT9MNN4_9ACTN|nr:hypothetical protein [Catenuloplanes nepalensis]MDP9793014.1 hypothetical protein [Catenuloplanes nepalensis]